MKPRGRALVGVAAFVLVLALALEVQKETLPREPGEIEAPQGPGESVEPAASADVRALLDEAYGDLEAGRVGSALRRLDRAAAATEDPPVLMDVFNRLGLTSKRLGDYHRALDSYQRALELAERVGDRGRRGSILHNIGSCFTALGEPELALDALEDALELRSTNWERAITLTAIATVDDLEGRHDRAMSRLEEALLLRRASPEVPASKRRMGLAATLDRLGTAARNGGRPQAARRAFESSRRLLETDGGSARAAIVEANLGRLLLETGDVEGALALLSRARPVLAAAGLRQDHDIALLATARALWQKGELETAFELALDAVDRIESLREEVGGPRLRSSFVASHMAFYETAVELAMARHRSEPGRGHAARALELAERAKARSLLDLLREGSRASRLEEDPRLRERIAWLERQLNRLEHRRLALLYRGAAISEIAAVEKEQRMLILENEDAWVSAKAESAPEPAPRIADLGEMRSLLDADTIFLVYSLGETGGFLWAVTSDRVEPHRLPARGEVEGLVEKARNALELSDQPGGYDDGAVRELAAVILPGSLDLWKGTRLAILPDVSLQTIPFAVLPNPGTGRMLIEDHPILYLPSVSALGALRDREARRRRAPRRLAVIADPVYGPTDPRLPETVDAGPPALERLVHSRREAEAILRWVPADQQLGLIGFDARRRAMVEGGLEGFQILHMSVHAEWVEDRPELTSLVLSQFDRRGRAVDGRVFMHEIGSLSLPSDLVVLSACNSALGREVKGEGIVGLTRAFFLAGVSRSLVSLWYVDDRATAELMILFYRGLFDEGLPPDAALRQAQLRLGELEERWRVPYFWAGFVLMGDWRRPDLRGRL